MIDEMTLRVVAVAAAVFLVAGPSVMDAVKQVFSRVKSSVSGEKQEAAVDDAHTVVEIARRLRKSGNTKGADLCKQLLDVMLSSEPKP